MKTGTLKSDRDWSLALGSEQVYASAIERYHELLREAEQYRQEYQAARPPLSSYLRAASRSVVHMLNLVKL